MTMYYFGAHREAGHFLWGPEMRRAGYRFERGLPFGVSILDGQLLPPDQPQIEGHAHMSYVNGWTILTFWDRSVDSRGNSNSAFLCKGMWEFNAIVTDAKTNFPDVWNRFKFEVVDINRVDKEQVDLLTETQAMHDTH